MTQYQRDLSKAIRTSQSLYSKDWKPLFDVKDQQDYRLNSDFIEAVKAGYTQIIDKLVGEAPKDQACTILSMGLYWHLNLLGYPVEIILGDTVFEGSGKFYGVTPKSLCNEFKDGASSEILRVHAWIQIGQNTIIDYGLPEACKKNSNLGSIGRQIASEDCVFHKADYLESIGLRYMPMILGEKFVAKTNANPLCDFSLEKKIISSGVRSNEGLNYLIREFMGQ